PQRHQHSAVLQRSDHRCEQRPVRQDCRRCGTIEPTAFYSVLDAGSILRTFRMLLLLVLLFTTGALAQTGESIYLAQCSFCHGQRGEGGRGATLARPKLHHAADDESLNRIIRYGIPNSGMPGTALSESEIRLVAAHVRSLGRVQPGPVPGD